MPEKSERFVFVLSPDERAILSRIAELERISAGAVIRRLIWREGRKLCFLPHGESVRNRKMSDG